MLLYIIHSDFLFLYINPVPIDLLNTKYVITFYKYNTQHFISLVSCYQAYAHRLRLFLVFGEKKLDTADKHKLLSRVMKLRSLCCQVSILKFPPTSTFHSSMSVCFSLMVMGLFAKYTHN